jgi:natural product precursor
MKKLGKLNIHSRNQLSNSDLLTLRGGTNSCYYCECQPSGVPSWYSWASSQSAAQTHGQQYCSEGDSAVCESIGDSDPDNCYHPGY